MKIHCLYNQLDANPKLFHKLFSELQKLPRRLKVRASELTKQNYSRDIIDLCGILFSLKTAKTYVFPAHLNLCKPRGPAVLAGSFKASGPSSFFVPSVISVMAKSQIFSRIIQAVPIDVVDDYAGLSVQYISVQVQFLRTSFTNISTYVVSFANKLGVPFKKPIRFQSFIGFDINFCIEAF